MGPTPPDDLRPQGWLGSLAWALAFSLWAAALIGVTIAAASTCSTWRKVVHGYQHDAETIVYDEMFPNLPPAPLRSAADAANDIALANHEYRAELAVRGVIAAALLGAAFVYRRALPPGSRPRRRAWLLVVPLILVIAAAALLVFAAALGGAIKG